MTELAPAPDQEVEIEDISTPVGDTEAPAKQGGRVKRMAQRLGRIEDALEERTSTAVFGFIDRARARMKGDVPELLSNGEDEGLVHGADLAEGGAEMAETDPYEELEAARSKLAKLSARNRYGAVSKRSLEKAQTAYEDALAEVIETDLGDAAEREGRTEAELRRKAVQISIDEIHRKTIAEREYLENSKYAKFLNWWSNLSYAKKAALGLTVGLATGGIVGLVGSMVAGVGASAAVATRLARTGANTQARMLAEHARDDYAVLHEEAERQTVAVERAMDEQSDEEPSDDRIGTEVARSLVDEIYATQEEVRQNNRQKLALGVGVMATSLVLGAGVAQLLNEAYHGDAVEAAAPRGAGDGGSGVAEAPEGSSGSGTGVTETINETPSEAGGGGTETLIDNALGEAGEQADASGAVENASDLFEDLSGKNFEIKIEAGDNLWDKLEALDELQGKSYTERQRIVGNVIKLMKEQNPGRDLNLVYPGEVFKIEIP